jgi:hypothetical protein
MFLGSLAEKGPCALRSGDYSTPAHSVDEDAIKDWNKRLHWIPEGVGTSTRLPPLCMLMKHGMCVIPQIVMLFVPGLPYFPANVGSICWPPQIGLLVFFLSFRQFLVSPKDDDAHPLSVIYNFIQFDTDPWVGSHPLDFLARRRKAIEIRILVNEIDGNNVGLILVRTRQPAQSVVGERTEAFSFRHLVYQHQPVPRLF